MAKHLASVCLTNLDLFYLFFQIYTKNKNLYTVEANNARQLVESAATNIEKLLRNRSKALEVSDAFSYKFQCSLISKCNTINFYSNILDH